MSWKSSTHYETAIYWFRDGAYGAAHHTATEEQARASKAEFERQHYDVPDQSEVHIRKVVIERIV
jgi:hypothetical protein